MPTNDPSTVDQHALDASQIQQELAISAALGFIASLPHLSYDPDGGAGHDPGMSDPAADPSGHDPGLSHDPHPDASHDPGASHDPSTDPGGSPDPSHDPGAAHAASYDPSHDAAAGVHP